LTRVGRVRDRVLAAACSLAVLGYFHRVGFATAAPELQSQLDLTDRDLSYLMAAFMVAYGVVEVPCGLIGDRLGVRHLLTILVLGWSLATAAIGGVTLMPVATFWPLAYLLALRILFGLFQGGMFPSMARMMTDWMPIDDRASAQGWIWMSSRLGGAVAPLLVVPLFELVGTGPATYWLLASPGAIWCALFWPWFRNRPEQMPAVAPAERARIAAGRSVARTSGGHAPVPWRTMLRSSNVWSLCLMYGALSFTGNFFITLLPSYLRSHRHLGTRTAGWLSSLPLACGVVGCVLGGFLSDELIRRTCDRKWGRRLVGAFGLSLAATALLATIWVRDPAWLGVLLATTFFGNDLAMGPAWAACTDIGERYAGTLGGTMNMTGSLTGAAGAVLIGHLLDAGKPVTLFIILAGTYALGALAWMGVDATRPLEGHPAAGSRQWRENQNGGSAAEISGR
jgi:sugar phosphate permease